MRVVSGEIESTRFAIHFESGNVVAALIAAVEELAGRIEVETARIVPTRPFIAGVFQRAIRADGEDADAIVQPVADVDVFAIGGDQNPGAEVTAREAGG